MSPSKFPLYLAAAANLWLAFPAQAGPSPVVVELFTSQGCSSCPPAEDWLNGKGMDLFRQGRVIPLAFHVDYWDGLGWKDPFSTPQNTQRQRRYASFWNERSVYTPQMVVQGRTGFVGSDGERAEREIGRAKRGPFPFRMRVHPTPLGFRLDLTGKASGDNEVWAVLFQNACATSVPRGENGGRTLEENFVVREWQGMVQGTGNHLGFSFKVPSLIDRKDLGIAVFLQGPSDLGIRSAQCVFPLCEGGDR